MARFFAGVAACFLLLTGAFLLWQGRAAESSKIPAAPERSGAAVPLLASSTAFPAPPEASPKARDQQRFDRADKDNDGRVTAAELFEPRHKAFAKLDKDGNGSLSFDEWAVKTEQKFAGADQDH